MKNMIIKREPNMEDMKKTSLTPAGSFISIEPAAIMHPPFMM